MNKISSDLRLLQSVLRREQRLRREKPPRDCGVCSVNYMCNYDIDGFCFWKREYEQEEIQEIEEALE